MSKITAFFRAKLWTIVTVFVLVMAVFGLVGSNRSRQKALETVLAGGAPADRDAAAQALVENGRLADLLLNTERPEEDAGSPPNLRSLRIRRNAADSVSRLSAAQKITPQEAFTTLFSLCKDGDAGVKATAENGLTALGRRSDADLNAVVGRLSDGDPDIRSAAVDVLGLIGGAKTAVRVDGVLGNPAAQDSAILALQKIGVPSVPLIAAHLEDPARRNDLTFRQQMVGVLDQIAAPAGIPELIKIAGLPGQPSVQRLAQVALADMVLAAHASAKTAQAASPEVQNAEATLRGILSDTNAASESRAQAALALGQNAGPSTIAALIAGLGDYDAQVRAASQTGLQAAGAPAAGSLAAALTQGQTLARAGAAQALGGIGTPAAVAALTSVFHAPATSDAVREGAVVGLGRSSDPAVIPTLVQALGDRDGAVAGAAQTGLLTPALAKAAIPQLVAALSQPTPVPFNASETLARMGALAETEAVPLLTRLSATGNAPAQTWAAVTLGEIGSKSAPVLSALQGLSRSADPHVQYAASQSLLRLTGS